MGFDSLLMDRVSILKSDGSRFDNIPASVQGCKIFLNQAQPLIEASDLVFRKMSNGAEETFKVLDPGFHEAFHGIPAGYQMSVEKLGMPEAKKAVQSITYNVMGNNARINLHSVDSSINSVTDNSAVQKELVSLRSEIASLNLSGPERQAAEDVIDVVDAQFAAGHPKRAVVSALLAALPQVANVATIVSAIVGFAH